MQLISSGTQNAVNLNTGAGVFVNVGPLVTLINRTVELRIQITGLGAAHALQFNEQYDSAGTPENYLSESELANGTTSENFEFETIIEPGDVDYRLQIRDNAGVSGSVTIEWALYAESTNLPGSGTAVTLRFTDDGELAGEPVANAQVFVTTDAGGQTVWAGAMVTNVDGEVVVLLNLDETYYVWAQLSGRQPVQGEELTPADEGPHAFEMDVVTGVAWYYADQGDVEDIYGIQNIAQWSNLDGTTVAANTARITMMGQKADRHINRFLRARGWSTPIDVSSDDFDTLSDINAEMTGVLLYQSRRHIQDDQTSEVAGLMEGHWKNAMDELLDLAARGLDATQTIEASPFETIEGNVVFPVVTGRYWPLL